jgi:NAD-dependent SIR2 family protein deacetylase
MPLQTAEELLQALGSTAIGEIAEAIFRSPNLVFLTGAGISTESGVPDYRSPHRGPYKPMQHAAFVGDRGVRQRYWARSTIGYPQLCLAEPNDSHRLIAGIEEFRRAQGLETWLITQNVDGLHARAGSSRVLELHGSIHRVGCLDCRVDICRGELQLELERLNADGLLSVNAASPTRADGDADPGASQKPDGDADPGASQKPDGDADVVVEGYIESFRLPHLCKRPSSAYSPVQDSPSGVIIRAAKAAREASHQAGDPWSPADFADALSPGQQPTRDHHHPCTGRLMPRVVFHGGSLPRAVTKQSMDIAAACQTMVVLGSTLSTYSALRLAKLAHTNGAKVFLINFGDSRASPFATYHVQASISAALKAVCAQMMPPEELLALVPPPAPSPLAMIERDTR